MSDILLVGATGMVGSALVTAMADQPLTIISRRAVDVAGATHRQEIAPSDQWSALIAAARPATFISCLGTTIRQAGSQAAFRAVDHDLVLGAARAAKAAGARHMISISSVGAAAGASNFYLRTKGEVEEALKTQGFERLDIIRPGLLMGDRSGPSRPGEALGMLLAPLTDALMLGSLRKYRSIKADHIARAILALAALGGTGVHIHEHDAIMALAGNQSE
jgi:uncharacterized protein YbjT (DUF2867 family)